MDSRAPSIAPPTWSCHPPPVVIIASTARTALNATLDAGHSTTGRPAPPRTLIKNASDSSGSSLASTYDSMEVSPGEDPEGGDTRTDRPAHRGLVSAAAAVVDVVVAVVAVVDVVVAVVAREHGG